jgi:hypothetical protein
MASAAAGKSDQSVAALMARALEGDLTEVKINFLNSTHHHHHYHHHRHPFSFIICNMFSSR